MKLKINFMLKTGLTGEVPVLAILNFGYKEFDITKQKNVYKPLKYYTGIKVNESDWDVEKKLPRQRNKQAELIQMETRMREIFTYLDANGTLTSQELKNELDTKLKGKSTTTLKRVRIVDFIETEILNCTSLRNTTKVAYKDLSNRLVLFEKRIGKSLYSNDFNEDVYKLFIEEVRLKVNRQNTVWSIFKNLRATLIRIEKKYKISIFRPTLQLTGTDKIRFLTEDKVYLDYHQIQKIIDYKPTEERLKNAKLMFLTLLFTGCRYSDVHKVIPQHEYSKDGITFMYARFMTQKNDKEVIVPILKPLMNAIDDNGGKMAIKTTETAFNLYVKELINKCGIKDEFTLSYSDSYGKKQFETKAFNDFVSSHTGRRSFITNLINFIPITILTKITTHELKDTSIIFGYNKISLLENTVQFVRELARLRTSHKEHFIFDLV